MSGDRMFKKKASLEYIMVPTHFIARLALLFVLIFSVTSCSDAELSDIGQAIKYLGNMPEFNFAAADYDELRFESPQFSSQVDISQVYYLDEEENNWVLLKNVACIADTACRRVSLSLPEGLDMRQTSTVVIVPVAGEYRAAFVDFEQHDLRLDSFSSMSSDGSAYLLLTLSYDVDASVFVTAPFIPDYADVSQRRFDFPYLASSSVRFFNTDIMSEQEYLTGMFDENIETFVAQQMHVSPDTTIFIIGPFSSEENVGVSARIQITDNSIKDADSSNNRLETTLRP